MRSHLPENLLDRLIAEAEDDDYALARQEHPAAPNARRVLAAGAVFAVIGLLFTAAFWQRQTVQPAAQDRREALIERVSDYSGRAEASQQQAEELRASVSQLQQLASSGLGPGFAEQLQALEIATGFVALKGPGAVLSMADAEPPLPRGVEPDEAKVLDIDMQTAVNGLWEAGAEAIAINGIRLTSLTAIRTAGEAILVDYKPLEPPYEVVAIGPSDLAETFSGSDTYAELEQLRTDYGIQSEVTGEDGLTVPASTSNLPTRAEVVKGGVQ
ncbi:MAG: DUF881 domain-containing protein [Candidatus Nanopelagicales bacterium]